MIQHPPLLARQALAELFFGALSAGPTTMESFEDEALGVGHAVMAEAMAAALERYDAELCAALPAGTRVHDRRGRTRATKVGAVSFGWTRVHDRRGLTEVPLADALDLLCGCRVSPAASAFLVAAGAEVSCARAARLLCRAGGSRVSSTTVMLALRAAGGLCAEEGAALARSLYSDGVLPGGSQEAGELCLEADVAWFSVQKPAPGEPKRLEVKAICAYAVKEERGGRIRRVGVARHAMVGAPSAFTLSSISCRREALQQSSANGGRVYVAIGG